MVVINTHDQNPPYDIFLNQFLKIYNEYFPFKIIMRKILLSPWITKGLINQKQKLYIYFFKN